MPHTIGGTVSGLSGSGLTLLDNGTDALRVSSANGAGFTFASSVLDGSAYSVTVSSQPTSPWQTCSVAHGSGTVSGSDITNVAVTCTTNSYTLGGTVSGLTGSGLVLAGIGENLSVASAGPFVFSNPYPSGSQYTVTVGTQPTNPPQTCVVGSGSGTVGGSNITTVSVSCTNNTYTVGGYVAGLVGSGLAVSYNNGPPLAISRSGAFTAATGVTFGGAYSVAIVSQPTNPAQTCALSSGSGTVGSVNVTSIAVFCPQAVGRWAYVETEVNIYTLGTISLYTIDAGTGSLALVPGSAVDTGPTVYPLQFVPNTHFAWVLALGQLGSSYPLGSIWDYTVDPNTGLLTAVAGNPFTALQGTSSTPGVCTGSGLGDTGTVTFYSGTLGYAYNGSSVAGRNAGLWEFSVDPVSGAPSLVPGSELANCHIGPVIIDPSRQFAYSAEVVSGVNAGSSDIHFLTINATTGALTEAPGSPINIQAIAGKVIVDPWGRFAYALGDLSCCGPAGLWAFAIDSSSGALTVVPGSPFPIAAQPYFMTIDPRGQFAYLTTQGALYTYSINAATGALTADATTAIAGIAPLVIDPSGQFAYMPAGSGVYAYSINASTGALTPIVGSPFATGPPAGVTITN